MTLEELKAAGIPLSGDETHAVLHAEAALDWMKEHTTLDFDKTDAESIKALPACAKLFVVKYSEVLRRTAGMISQSIEGLSMSFDASDDVSTSVWALANTLLQGYMRSQVKVTPARRRW